MQHFKETLSKITTIMKKLLTFLTACVLSCTALSATPVKDRTAPKSQEKPIEKDTLTGPTGILKLKIGMTKEEVDALTSTDDIFLSEQLVENTKLNKFGKWYDGKLKFPLSDDPVKTTMVFDNEGSLSYFSLELSEKILEGIEKQLVEKYGAAKVEEKNKEEQCIYKNGANFKLQNKDLKMIWTTSWKDSFEVKTSINFLVEHYSCPENLSSIMLSPIKINSLSFTRKELNQATQLPKKNIF